MEKNGSPPPFPSLPLHPGSVLRFLAGVIALLLLVSACGGDGKSGGPAKGETPDPPGGKGKGPSTKGSPAQTKKGEGVPVKEPALHPRDRKRIEQALVALKNNLFLNDPEGFAKDFLDVRSLKNILIRTQGKDAWNKMVKAVGKDELEFKKHYRKSLDQLFKDLQTPGVKCSLTQEAILAIKRGAVPPTLLYADKCNSPLGKMIIVVLAGFHDAKALRGLFRLRVLPHQNRLPWYLAGDEKIDALETLTAGEEERVASGLRNLAKAQDAFRDAKHADRDGDGRGEFAFLPELAGVVEVRGTDGCIASGLTGPFREVSKGGVVLSGTHLFCTFLPGPSGPVAGERGGAPESAAVTDAREQGWCAVAWPVAQGAGKGLYFVGPSGTVLKAKSARDYAGMDPAPPAAVGFAESGGE
ncbi:MAG: hypothetical protein ACYTHM_16560, partial [Planctomycetota bacterium]